MLWKMHEKWKIIYAKDSLMKMVILPSLIKELHIHAGKSINYFLIINFTSCLGQHNKVIDRRFLDTK